jgi:hypothetical protein
MNWSLTDGGASSGTTPGHNDVVCMSTSPTSAIVSLTSTASDGAINWPDTASVHPSLTLQGGLTI